VTVSSLIQLAIPVFFVLIALEAFVAARREREIADARDTASSLALGVGSVLVGLAWGGVAFAAYTALYTHRVFVLSSTWSVFALALVADDFAYYWFHRLHHEVRLFWAAHVTHHSSQRYNLSTALRQSWTPMTALPFFAPLAWLGIDPALLITVHSINLLYQFWIHTELIGRCPAWLEAVFNTPSHHRVHHGANPRYLDRNYAGILILWDRLFGTFEAETEPVRFGLTKNVATHHPVRLAFHEFAAIARDVWRARSWSARLGHLLAPPGWRPDLGDGVRASAHARSPGRAVAGGETQPA
jgi:sterol desaturase/sphingolipid hydroxylase (fatty acid hydroxylase superfamily)